MVPGKLTVGGKDLRTVSQRFSRALTRWLAGLWATFALFLVLSAGAAGIYGVILEKCSAIAVAQREVLSEKLCR